MKNDLADGTYRIVAPDFVAGIAVKNGVVIQEAPRLRYLHKSGIAWVRYHCGQKGWTLERIPDAQERMI